MDLRLYNSATRQKEEFQPLEPGKVGIYVCGVTVYDLCHIGHARSAIVFDVMVRYLRARGLEVTYIRNFTDIDDKIIARAEQLGKETKDVAEEYIQTFYEDMGRIGVLNADVEPRATEHIPQMIDMIKVLIDKGFAYVRNGDVFYSVESFKDYGGLSGRKLDDMKAGSRIAVDEKKKHPMDFVLWKAAKPGEPQWQSPWGPGRPGWHLECSVMSNGYLGPTFDIHGGGRDLLFPHHENERAQSLAALEGGFARYWVHNGFVTVESEKMSKSLGNFLTIRDALKTYHPEVLRLFLLSRHYRSPLDFSRDAVLDLQAGLVRIYRTIQRMEGVIGSAGKKKEVPIYGLLAGEQDDPFLEGFIRFMNDDLNTAGALGHIFEKVKEMNRAMDALPNGSQSGAQGVNAERLTQDRDHLLKAGRVLGLLEGPPEDFFARLSSSSDAPDSEDIEKLIQERAEARAERDWAKADAIRDRLDGMGIILEDGPQGTVWRYKV